MTSTWDMTQDEVDALPELPTSGHMPQPTPKVFRVKWTTLQRWLDNWRDVLENNTFRHGREVYTVLGGSWSSKGAVAVVKRLPA